MSNVECGMDDATLWGGLAVVLLLGGCGPVQLMPFVSPVLARPADR